jgi:hypothetical protein
MSKLWRLMAAGLALATATVALPALAQSYPPSGSVDVVGRLLAAKLIRCQA